MTVVLLVAAAAGGVISAEDRPGDWGPVCLTEDCAATAMPWTGPAVNSYVARVAAKLSRPGGLNRPLRVRVIYWPEVYCRAHRSGWVLVSTGSLTLLQSEAELASLLTRAISLQNTAKPQRRARRAQQATQGRTPSREVANVSVTGPSEFATARAEVLRYEQLRAQILGEITAGGALPPLRLSRRPELPTSLAQVR
jgi:predicted Zn-dependent protease